MGNGESSPDKACSADESATPAPKRRRITGVESQPDTQQSVFPLAVTPSHGFLSSVNEEPSEATSRDAALRGYFSSSQHSQKQRAEIAKMREFVETKRDVTKSLQPELEKVQAKYERKLSEADDSKKDVDRWSAKLHDAMVAVAAVTDAQRARNTGFTAVTGQAGLGKPLRAIDSFRFRGTTPAPLGAASEESSGLADRILMKESDQPYLPGGPHHQVALSSNPTAGGALSSNLISTVPFSTTESATYLKNRLLSDYRRDALPRATTSTLDAASAESSVNGTVVKKERSSESSDQPLGGPYRSASSRWSSASDRSVSYSYQSASASAATTASGTSSSTSHDHDIRLTTLTDEDMESITAIRDKQDQLKEALDKVVECREEAARWDAEVQCRG